jgi:eukaryotic-like serine/threonine-protein kinase
MPALAEGSRIGPYRIVRQLGEGGMGAVFEAVHAAIERHVAIKVLHREQASRQEMVGRFFNEARAVNLIDHPSLVQVADFGLTDDGLSFIVMELVRGEALSKRLRSGRLSVAQAVDIARHIAFALAATHDKNIVHRDLKPDNVMLVADPERSGSERLKILDFGIAKLMEQEHQGQLQTNADLVMGTPAYMSPEQCRGASYVDTKADVYSLGVILYEMLSGRLPFVAEDSGSLIGMHLFKVPPPLQTVAPHVPEPLAALVDRLLLKDKLQRPAMRELAEQLRQLAEGTTLTPQAARRGWRAVLPRPVWPDRARNSSLGLVTGQLEGPLRQGVNKHHAARAAGVLGIFVLSSLGYLFLSARHPTPQQQILVAHTPAVPLLAVAPTEPPLMPPSRQRMVRWEIASDPPGAEVGAEVVRGSDGVVLGMTPLSQEQPAQSARVTLHLRLAGYQPVQVTMDQETHGQVDKRLAPIRFAPLKAPHKVPLQPRSTHLDAAPPPPNSMETSHAWHHPKETDLLEK